MKKNIRVGPSATSAKPALQYLDESSPCLQHAAAHGQRYQVVRGNAVIATIGPPPPPPPPPFARVNGEGVEKFWC
jgi:hypothetical protein